MQGNTNSNFFKSILEFFQLEECFTHNTQTNKETIYNENLIIDFNYINNDGHLLGRKKTQLMKYK